MTALPDFLRPLEFGVPPFPAEAVAAALARPQESVPHLLAALEWATQNPEEANAGDPLYMLHIHALHILAQLREPKAFPYVIEMFHLEDYESLTGEVAVETLPKIFASVVGDQLEGLQAVVEDDHLDEWVRSAALEAFGTLILQKEIPQTTVSEFFGTLFAGGLEREASFVWDTLVGVATDFRMSEHLPAIEQAFEDELVDPMIDTLDVIRQDISRTDFEGKRLDLGMYQFITDAAADLAEWECYHSDDEGDSDEPSTPVVREAPKVGRNDLCPCGSGKKFKKCCGK